jgi:Plasmid pRiA4b ORF-3-like protein
MVIKNRSSSTKILLLRIELIDIEPVIWREVLVPDHLTFDDLHTIIQFTIGWENCHLYAFRAGGRRDGVTIQSMRDPMGGMLDFGFMDGPEHDAENTTLSNFLSAVKDSVVYEYDFGDSWEHKVSVKKILSEEEIGQTVPRCIGGARRGPPEDCGGVGGYYHLCEVLADKNHPEHKEMLEWFGGEVPDFESFSVEEADNAIDFFRPKKRPVKVRNARAKKPAPG